jgi:predicted HD superfamily hydrolase involved in NAD metabolism
MTTTATERILADFDARLSDARRKHILGVRDTVIEYAEAHGLSVSRAEAAALLHDCAKGMSLAGQFAYCERFGVSLTDDDRQQPAVLHALVAGDIAAREYGMDAEVCQAIRAHTTGWKPMSLLDMALYVADFSEPSRPYPEAAKARQMAHKDLVQASIFTMTYKLRVLLERGGLIHPRTVDARNALLLS